MAWVTPTDVATGDVLTASKWNQDVVENTIRLRGDFASFRRTTGTVTLTGSTTWGTLTTIGTGGDLTIAAQTGDLVEVSVSALFGNENVAASIDPVTVVSGTVTNSFSANGAAPTNWSTNNGFAGWFCPAAAFTPISGSVFYTLVSGDISSGAVTLRLRYATDTATNRTLYASTANPFVWWARNHGPVEI